MLDETNSVAYQQGQRAYWNEKKQLNNPYPFGSPEFNDFERGWVQACKRDDSHSSHGIEYSRFQRERDAPRLPATFEPYEDPEEQKKREARAYAKATGHSRKI